LYICINYKSFGSVGVDSHFLFKTKLKTMSDRSAAWAFGTFFKILAKNPSEQNKEDAKEVWKLSGEFDFDYYQMSCDEALIALGLATAFYNQEEEMNDIQYHG
jgi:hypothetical protein